MGRMDALRARLARANGWTDQPATTGPHPTTCRCRGTNKVPKDNGPSKPITTAACPRRWPA